MAWVRWVRTASGATAVQVPEYVDGRRRIVAHSGSAHIEAEVGILVERARELLGEHARRSSTWVSSPPRAGPS